VDGDIEYVVDDSQFRRLVVLEQVEAGPPFLVHGNQFSVDPSFIGKVFQFPMISGTKPSVSDSKATVCWTRRLSMY
jgi:hypothetical protein